MIIQCKSCSRKFVVKDRDIPKLGREVKCGYCSVTWHQMPVHEKAEIIEIKKTDKIPNQSLSVENIKASDGKTYKFLGNQWAELLPSGKTGIFAKKKINNELDRLTGRKKEKVLKKKHKKNQVLDPSLENINSQNQLPDIYKPKHGLGVLGFTFLLIIIAFSLVGVLKTFEKDLVENFIEAEYIFELLNEQLDYVAETIKNIFVIVSDLINSY